VNYSFKNVKVENKLRPAQIAIWPGDWMDSPVDWRWGVHHLLTLSGLCSAPGSPWSWPGSEGAVWMPLNLLNQSSINTSDFESDELVEIFLWLLQGWFDSLTTIISKEVNHCDYILLLKVAIIHRRSDISQNEGYFIHLQ